MLTTSQIFQAEGEEGATAASLALEGIAVLCREGVIDMRTTAKVTLHLFSVDLNQAFFRFLPLNAALT